MMTNRYLIGGKVVEVSSIWPDVHCYCKDYLTDLPADFTVTVTTGHIAYEREKARREQAAEGLPFSDYPDGYLEELAVYRQIAEQMILYDTVLFHGSVIAVDGQAYLFTAKSGTGKSTHTRLWREYFGSRAVMVNDDKPLLHITEAGVTVFGTPYNGKHGLGENTSAPLKALCILTRAQDNTIRAIPSAEAYSILLQQVYRPADVVRMKRTLELIDRLAEQVPLYRLGCNMEPDAARVAYEGMQ